MLSGFLNCKSPLSCNCYIFVQYINIGIPNHIQHQEQCDHLLSATSHSTTRTLLSQPPLRCLSLQGSNNSYKNLKGKKKENKIKDLTISLIDEMNKLSRFVKKLNKCLKLHKLQLPCKIDEIKGAEH